MKLFQTTLAFAAFFATFSAQGEQPAASRDTNLLLILPDTAAGGSTTSGTTLTPQDAEEIARQCPAISQVAPIVQPPAHLSYDNRHWHPSHFIGSTPSFLTAREWTVIAGASFTDVDVRNATKVCLIGETVKQKMFRDESPIGKTIHFQNDLNIPFRPVDFRVIGVLGHTAGNCAVSILAAKSRRSTSPLARFGACCGGTGGLRDDLDLRTPTFPHHLLNAKS